MVVAFVLIMSKTGQEKEVLDNIRKLNEVREASIVFGDYDIIAKVDVSNVENLNDLLLSKIRKIHGVSMTTTLIGI